VCEPRASTQDLSSEPVFFHKVVVTPKEEKQLILRGDSGGRVAVWNIPEISDKAVAALQQETFGVYPELHPVAVQSLEGAWSAVGDQARGIVDHLGEEGTEMLISSTLYVPTQGRLILGRRDGGIVIVSATQTLMRQLLDVRGKGTEWPPSRVLYGHKGPVTCLLYPHEEHPR
jgi:WD repeat-containing protein 7